MSTLTCRQHRHQSAVASTHNTNTLKPLETMRTVNSVGPTVPCACIVYPLRNTPPPSSPAAPMIYQLPTWETSQHAIAQDNTNKKIARHKPDVCLNPVWKSFFFIRQSVMWGRPIDCDREIWGHQWPSGADVARRWSSSHHHHRRCCHWRYRWVAQFGSNLCGCAVNVGSLVCNLFGKGIQILVFSFCVSWSYNDWINE